MKPMKQPATPFSFKKNDGVHALPEAVPPELPASTVRAPVKRTEKPKERQVSCYLTEEEYAALLTKLDGRPISASVRNLVLQFINNG